MKQKNILIIVGLVFALLLAAAFPLYNRLSEEDTSNQLVLLPQGDDAAAGPQLNLPVNKPKPTEPKPIEPTPTEPKPIEPTPTEPKPTEPKPTEPKPTEPTPTEPTPTEPKPTEPKPTEPKPTEPTPTEPAPTEPTPTEPPVELAYDFTVYDGNGRAVKLSDYVGKPIVLNFWASWCGPCKSEMPEFQKVYEDLGGEVQFLMVNATVSDTMADAKAFIQQYGYTFPVLFDTYGDALTTFGITAFPTTYFIDKDGNLMARAVGAINEKTLLQGIALITK